MPILLSEMRDRFANRPAAILGGGPSLPDDLKKLPKGCVLFSVNDHALHYCNPDFLVFVDIPNRQIFPELAHAVETFEGEKISITPLSDVDLYGLTYWDGGFTSTLATWCALFLDCDPVILCGMDCYQGEPKYCHPRPDFYHPVLDFPLENHLSAWRGAFEHCPHPERIRAMSGPLVELFGEYSVEIVC